MKYINLIFFAILITSCSTTVDKNTVSSSGQSPLEQSDSERRDYKKALSLLNSDNLSAAKEILLQLNSDRPELAGPYANLAVIALKNNQPNEALTLVKTALTKNPKLPQALNLLAYLEQISGEILLAEKHYKEAIQYKDDYAIAHYNIALLYDVYLQDVDKAIPHYEKYMELIDNNDKNTADWLEQIKRNKDKS